MTFAFDKLYLSNAIGGFHFKPLDDIGKVFLRGLNNLNVGGLVYTSRSWQGRGSFLGGFFREEGKTDLARAAELEFNSIFWTWQPEVYEKIR